MRNKKTIGLAATLALGLLGAATAQASVISLKSNVDFSTNVYTLNLGNGAASFSFKNAMDDAYFNNAQIKTGGNGIVASNPTVFGGGPAAFFTGDRAPFIDGALFANSQAFPDFTTIRNSSNDTYIAFNFLLADGLHYGYAETSGTDFLGYGYESVAGMGLQAGAVATPVPEPGSLAMLAFGLALVGAGSAAARRRKN